MKVSDKSRQDRSDTLVRSTMDLEGHSGAPASVT